MKQYTCSLFSPSERVWYCLRSGFSVRTICMQVQTLQSPQDLEPTYNARMPWICSHMRIILTKKKKLILFAQEGRIIARWTTSLHQRFQRDKNFGDYTICRCQLWRNTVWFLPTARVDWDFLFSCRQKLTIEQREINPEHYYQWDEEHVSYNYLIGEWRVAAGQDQGEWSLILWQSPSSASFRRENLAGKTSPIASHFVYGGLFTIPNPESCIFMFKFGSRQFVSLYGGHLAALMVKYSYLM